MKKFLFAKLSGLLGTKMLTIVLASVLAAGSIGAGGYIIYDYESLPKEMEAAQIAETVAYVEEVPEEEPEPILEEEEPEEEELEEEAKELSLVATSIEKDLKIKVQDQNSKLVTGVQFAVSVKSDQKNAKASDHEDKDKDGIIYIDKIEAGKYTVTLQEVEGYIIKDGVITATVKDKIEYKKVDVTAEIKKESQVNTAAEDTEVKNVPVESTLKDTVPLLPSKVISKSVAKKNVAAPSYPAASASSTPASVVCEMKKATSPTEPEKPDTGETGDKTENGDGENKDDEDNSGVETAAIQTLALGEEIEKVTATVTIPSSVSLYDCDQASSNSYTMEVNISGDSSIIQSVHWSSTDAKVVSLSAESGNSVTISRKGKGTADVSAKITYSTDEAGSTGSVVLKSMVSVSDAGDVSATLKDTSGNTLYLDSEGKTVATQKDYASHDTFYTSLQYVGWQTIDGKVYYYDENHNKLTGSQVIGGVMYTFAGDGSLSQSSGNRGIDVSKYQGNIDWGAVAASGINFAIIRVGYRGSSTGVLVEDPYFKKNIAGASKAGIKVGVYFFTQAITEAEAVEEASMAMSLVSGYRLTYPIFIDTESASNGRANGLSKSARTAVVKAFCQTVQNGGYKAGVYASKSWYSNQLSASSLNNYCIWVAQYNSSCTYSGKYNMWQYSSKGSVSGIKGNVDMNISYTGY